MGANSPEVIRVIDRWNDRHPAETIRVVGFVDNDAAKKGTELLEFPVLGTPDVLSQPGYRDCFVANNITRDCRTRRETTEQLARYNPRFLSLVHPDVDVTRTTIGKGVMILEKCVVSPRTHIGDHAALMIGAVIAHDCTVGEFTFVGPAVHVCGAVTIGKDVYFGAGALVLPRLKIGDGAKVGAGSVVTAHVDADAFVWGNPARRMPGENKV